MNIFELYLDKIKFVIVELSKKNQLIVPESFNGINAEIPPPKFDCDISTNVAMVLSKLNKTSPIQLAEKLAPEIKNSDEGWLSNFQPSKNKFREFLAIETTLLTDK